MKFLITGDWHIDRDRIKTRKDSVFATVMGKLGELFQIAICHNCQAILQPGDFFESHKANDFLKQYIINFLKSKMAQVPVYTVFGQHDLRYHSSDTLNTPLRVLESAGVVNIIDQRGVIYPHNDQPIIIQGASWFQDIPNTEEYNGLENAVNILICHKMIVDTKIWEGQRDHTYGKILLKKTKYDLIVSGDNHKHFVMHSGEGDSIGKRILINCGSLLRTRIDQEDHKPCVYIYNTDPKEGEPFLQQEFLSIQPFEDVIRIEEAKKEKEENEKLKEFVDALSVDTQLTGINYKNNVYQKIKDNKDVIDDTTLWFINTVFAKLEGVAPTIDERSIDEIYQTRSQ